MTNFRQVLYSGKDLKAITCSHGYAEAVVTFKPWLVKPLGDDDGEASGFGEGAFTKRGVDELHIIPRRNHWYQTDEMEALLPLARDWLAGRRAVTYGSSMGGYGALAFAAPLGALSVALAPQFSIDRTVVPFEKRWVNEANAISTYNNMRINRQTAGYVFYDPLVRLDRLQAALIFANSQCKPVRCALAGHSVPAHVKSVMPLAEVVLDVLRGTFDPAAFMARRRKVRSAEINYVTNLYVALRRDGRTACADKAQDGAWQAASRDMRACRRLFFDAVTAGDMPRARELFVIGKGLLRGLPADYAQLAQMGWNLGDVESCFAIIDEGIAKAPRNVRLMEMREQWRNRLNARRPA